MSTVEVDVDELDRIASEGQPEPVEKSEPQPEPVAGGEYIPGGAPDDMDEKITATLCYALATTFRLVAPGWAVTDDEVVRLAESWTPVIRKYSGNKLSNIPIEIKAALATGEVVIAHVGEDLKPANDSSNQTKSQPEKDDFSANG